ncbi:hypothetical protein T11_3340 [Trichinella zimbabwensis]|uniref:Uncharacterized protein n=1 Tax=Trichinella zimbabwensis TaxID=268475 RepID=A0A0V1HCI4_9BILA|nr:hypothetical protein T11_3340 [Trichinella zimbabwensis]
MGDNVSMAPLQARHSLMPGRPLLFSARGAAVLAYLTIGGCKAVAGTPAGPCAHYNCSDRATVDAKCSCMSVPFSHGTATPRIWAEFPLIRIRSGL